MNAQDASNLAFMISQNLVIEESSDSEVIKQSLKTQLLNPVLLQEFVEKIQDELVFEIGFDNGEVSMNLTKQEYDNIITNFKKVCNKCDFEFTLLHTRNSIKLKKNEPKTDYYFGHVLLRRKPKNVQDLKEIRCCIVGNVDAGKSTLLGVLTKSSLDDGRGKARVNVFRFKHEIESGRTSSIGHEIIGFNEKGIINTTVSGNRSLKMDEICSKANKVVTFLDLAGHEKYLKTTVFGMTGCSPDFVMLIIGANAGVIGMTKEHLGLALALQVPLFIVVTKIDMTPPNILQNTISQLLKILKSGSCRKIPLFINGIEDTIISNSTFISQRVCPIFQISSVTGQGLSELETFLNLLKIENEKYPSDSSIEFQITDTYSVPGVGTVVGGTLVSGIVHQSDSLLLGPDTVGNFVPVTIKGIQRKRVNVSCVVAGSNCTFALKKTKRSAIRKGMVLVSKNIQPKAVYEFEAEVLILYHSTTINIGYEAMLHIDNVRQTAKIIGMNSERLRTGEKTIVHFKFVKNPEYIKTGTKILFREGRTKGIGTITKVGK